MNGRALAKRVENLEHSMDSFAPLPQLVAGLTDRVGHLESEIVQLRTGMESGFSAIRHDVLELFDAGTAASQRLYDELKQETRELRADLEQLRIEVRELRADVEQLRGEVRELRADVEQLRGEVRELRADVEQLRGEVRELRADVAQLRVETRRLVTEGDEATRTQMRVLHEDLVHRIQLLGESLRQGPRPDA